MDHHHHHVNEDRGGLCKSSSSSSSSSSIQIMSEEDDMMMMMDDLRRGPWTVDEDLTLMNYIANHGEGRWNSLARSAGLKRTGKSCRLRWLNYLRPDVRRGNITLEEQLLILELHSRWGNRWSKIAQHLPGRTDNEIKNYWRTRVQKHAKQLKCDVNSKQFKDTMRYLWMPRLVERIQAAAATTTSSSTAATGKPSSSANSSTTTVGGSQVVLPVPSMGYTNINSCDNSISTAASSDSFGTPVSDMTENYNSFPVNYNNTTTSYPPSDYFQSGYSDSLISPSGYYNNINVLDHFQGMDHQNNNNNNNNNQWMDGGDLSDNLWNVEDIWLLQQQFTNNI